MTSTAPVRTVNSATGNPWTVEAATEALTSGRSAVLAVSTKNADIIHRLKMDKNNRPRTLCGVPIGSNGGMLHTKAKAVSCPTCVAVVAKLAKA